MERHPDDDRSGHRLPAGSDRIRGCGGVWNGGCVWDRQPALATDPIFRTGAGVGRGPGGIDHHRWVCVVDPVQEEEGVSAVAIDKSDQILSGQTDPSPNPLPQERIFNSAQ